jgi:protein gp37
VADRSTIEWTDATWNPTTGCDRTSPGCDYCYALTLSKRLKAMGLAKYQRDGSPKTSGPGFGLTLHPHTLGIPLKWRSPRRVFVNSMSDLFHDDVPLGFIAEVFNVMRETPQHTYQLLTKRSRRLAKVADDLVWPSNLWMGVSIEDDRYCFRALHLKSVPAAIRFVSAEPLIGPVNSLDLRGLDWVIAGGESGIVHRPVSAEWIRDLRDRCQRAGVAFFFKQWGGPTPKANGRTLDGRTWDEMPVTATVRGAAQVPRQGPLAPQLPGRRLPLVSARARGQLRGS